MTENSEFRNDGLQTSDLQPKNKTHCTQQKQDYGSKINGNCISGVSKSPVLRNYGFEGLAVLDTEESENEKCKIWVKLYSNNGKFNLIIKDNGIGFPEGLNFKNTESLGLQLVNLLINQVDGSIELNQKRGTEFRIEFEELKYRERI
jgi:hypothetical protein